MLLFRSPVSTWDVTSTHVDNARPLGSFFAYPDWALIKQIGSSKGFSYFGLTVQVYSRAVVMGIHHCFVIALFITVNIILHAIYHKRPEVQPFEN